jgi:hypothetical protein
MANRKRTKVDKILHRILKIEQYEPTKNWTTQVLQNGKRFLVVSSFNKTDRHNITEILLKVVLNTITLILKLHIILMLVYGYF